MTKEVKSLGEEQHVSSGPLFYYNEYKLKEEIRSYLSIPGVFRTKKYPFELLTGD